jgi:GDPmannose 4,6-dehydratase
LALTYRDVQDFVLGMGETHTVRELISVAFKVVDVDIIWKGGGLNEVGIDNRTNSVLVRVEPNFFRDSGEMPCLFADIGKATALLGWTKKYNFTGMIETMVLQEIKILSQYGQ